jgi:hypothetical protein
MSLTSLLTDPTIVIIADNARMMHPRLRRSEVRFVSKIVIPRVRAARYSTLEPRNLDHGEAP